MALLAECNEIINVKTFARILANWDDVMDFSSGSCSALSITVFTEWISDSIVFAKSTPSVVIATSRCLIALRTTLTEISMTLRTELVHTDILSTNKKLPANLMTGSRSAHSPMLGSEVPMRVKVPPYPFFVNQSKGHHKVLMMSGLM